MSELGVDRRPPVLKHNIENPAAGMRLIELDLVGN